MDRIISNPDIFGGKPIIRGTRISVEFVLQLFASRLTEEEILREYSHLTSEDVQACLQYAADAIKNEVYLELQPA